MYIVGFSGPPHCGKDSIARAVVDQIEWTRNPIRIQHLAWPMREMGMNLLGFDPSDDAEYAALKETKLELLTRVGDEHGNFEQDTLRDFMIAVSEDFIKPRYGQEFWVNKLIADIRRSLINENQNIIVLIPDIGFQVESNLLIREMGSDYVLIVQITREGCDFSKDLRTYVGAERNLALENNGSIEEAATKVINRMSQMGWPVV